MYLYKNRHLNVRRIYNRETRAANIFSFIRERYHCTKYRSSPYYKGSLLWDALPVEAKNAASLNDFKKCLKNEYRTYDDVMS